VCCKINTNHNNLDTFFKLNKCVAKNIKIQKSNFVGYSISIKEFLATSIIFIVLTNFYFTCFGSDHHAHFCPLHWSSFWTFLLLLWPHPLNSLRATTAEKGSCKAAERGPDPHPQHTGILRSKKIRRALILTMAWETLRHAAEIF